MVLREQSRCSRGALVQWDKKNGKYRGHSHSHFKLNSMSTFRIPDSALAPLTEEECVILDGIRNHATCYAAYSTPGKLEWGVGLKVGDTVLARLPDRSGRGSSGGEYTTAIIRWKGKAGEYMEHRFGVEITVSSHACPWSQTYYNRSLSLAPCA